MALISCPECNKQVSDTAPSCPACGFAIAAASESRASGARLTTTQSTSKKLKMHTLIAVVLIVVGVIGFFSSTSGEPGASEPSAWPVLFFFVGFVWYLVTRFRIWWHHK